MKESVVQIGDGHVMGHMVRRVYYDSKRIEWYKGLKHNTDSDGKIKWREITDVAELYSLEDGYRCGMETARRLIGD